MTADIVSREEWQVVRREFYALEAELVEAKDALAARRRRLPRVRIEREYVFDAPDGEMTLLDLFDGRRQLIVYHFMTPGGSGEFCTSCSFWVDNIGHLAHLHARDTSLVLDCPVPLDRITSFKQRMGWEVPWVSSARTTFYADLFVDLDDGSRIQPGVSVFIREGDEVFHTYSTLQTGGELLNSTNHYLDLTPLGRQEEGLAFKHEWVRHHDSYGDRGASPAPTSR
jgi:predicted dithiol-disulfide oxidoreductase (DUF899 family)